MKPAILVVCFLLILPVAVTVSQSVEGYIKPSPSESGFKVSITVQFSKFEPISIDVRPDGYYCFDHLPDKWVELTVKSSSPDCKEKSEKLCVEKHEEYKQDFLLDCFPISIETTQELKGVITDTDGIPIPGVYVEVMHSDFGYQYTSTKQDGKFLFPNIPVGVYTLKAELLGMIPFETDIIKRESSKSFEVNITMEMMPFDFDIPWGCGRPLISVRSSTLEFFFDKEFLDRLP